VRKWEASAHGAEIMPKKAVELTAIDVSRLKQPGLHFVGGVAGLILQVEPSGGRSWILRVQIGTKRRDMGLGGFPDVTLAQAREAAREARGKIRKGVDPIEEARTARAMLKLAQANAVPFKRAAAAYIETQRASWKNAKHELQWTSSLENHAYGQIGEVLVRDIGLPDVMKVLDPIWRTKTETASRLRGRIESVLDWSTTMGYREGLNPARWKGHLENLLPAPGKITKERHHPALAVSRVGAFVDEVRKFGGMGPRALEFGILTAARSGEIRGATWREINLDEELWVIPAARMKMQNDHRVPLSEAAIALLKALVTEAGSNEEFVKPSGAKLVFPAPRGGKLSDATLNAVIKRMNEVETEDGKPRWIDTKDDRPAVQHGFRSTFRDWVSERTSYPNEMAEMALAHTISSKVEAAYRRGDLLDKRRQMMDDWAAFCSMTEPASGNVVPLRKAQKASV
jgi:integrase